jgi:hypothetical protein
MWTVQNIAGMGNSTRRAMVFLDVSAVLIAVLLGTAALASPGCGDDVSDEDTRSSDGGTRKASDGGTAGVGGSEKSGRDAATSGSAGSAGAAGNGTRDSGSGGGGRGGSGRGGTGGGSGGASGAAGRPATTIQCGASVCESAANSFARACCADEASSTCGTSVTGGRCTKPVTGTRGCPTFNVAGILMLPSCCTSKGMCGIDASMLGGPGCQDLATAADRARMAGASVDFPAPRVCDDIDADAGTETEADASL